MEENFLRKAIVFTGFGCNSNCVFCLQHSRKPGFFSKEKIIKEIADKRREGADWLVITGGEATIHRNFIDFVAFARGLGYTRIQTISNGRMFQNENFVRNAAAAGLTEATMSFHGATPKKHDGQTMVPGSFMEASKGTANCKKYGIHLSFNTALTKLNTLDPGDIVKYIHQDLGFEKFDYDIIGTAPSGRAWARKLLPEHKDVSEGIKMACEYAEKNKIICWVTRTPIQDMPNGFEYHKEPWETLTHDAVSMWDSVWTPEKKCPPLRCEFCEVEPLCSYIKTTLKKIEGEKLSYVTGTPTDSMLDWVSKFSNTFIIENPAQAPLVEKHDITPEFNLVFDELNFKKDATLEKLDNFKDVGIKGTLEFQVNKKSTKFVNDFKPHNVIFSPTNPYSYVKYTFEDSNRLVDTTHSLLSLDATISAVNSKNWKNLPLCIKDGLERDYWINVDDFSKPTLEDVNPRTFANSIISDIRVYDWKCWKCPKREKCPGFFGDYVKLFGFTF
ncbi:MAG: radical SAM protein [Candidatus Altiarchaeota archaeon]|nr:radical SAM protein [Candidatus Altiarchaeota archaeon]